MSKRLRFFDAFSGIGGFKIALENAGFECIGACDNDKYAKMLYYDDNSAVIGSNFDYAAIHQLGGQAGKGLKTEIPARPYLQLTDDDFAEIIDETTDFLK